MKRGYGLILLTLLSLALVVQEARGSLRESASTDGVSTAEPGATHDAEHAQSKCA